MIEGANELGEGMTLPENDVKLIGAQKQTSTKADNVENKISSDNPAEYNP